MSKKINKINANYAKDLLLTIAEEFNCDVIYLYANLLAIKQQLQQQKAENEQLKQQLEVAEKMILIKIQLHLLKKRQRSI